MRNVIDAFSSKGELPGSKYDGDEKLWRQLAIIIVFLDLFIIQVFFKNVVLKNFAALININKHIKTCTTR